MSDLVKVTMQGTIPTAQYANLQPIIEVEGATYEEAEQKALERMEALWNRVCEPGKELRVAQKAVQQPAQTNSYDEKVCEVSGSKVLFDEKAHTYVDSSGNKYLSGSVFSNRYKSPFNLDMIASRSAKAHGVPKEDLISMWGLNGDTSTALGTAVHNALELYGKYLQLSLKTKGTSEAALTKNEILKPIVESFYEGRESENAGYEVFIADEENRLCGFIDRLLILDEKKKVCRIQDYKTNANINKSQTILEPFKSVVPNTTLGAYWLQLSFYAYIMKRHGWTVEGLDVFSYEDGAWKTYTHDVVDISSEIK